MPPLYLLLSLRYLFHRWDRAILVVASIALGVATLVSARILNQCIETAATATTAPAAGAADLFVSNGELGVLRSVADDIRAADVPGVRSVTPLVFERVTLPVLNDRPAVLIGIELDQQLLADNNPFGAKVERLTPPTLTLFRRWVVVSRKVYTDWLVARADEKAPLVVRFGGRSIDCVPVAVLDFTPDTPLAQLGLSIVGMEVNQAARFVRPGPPPAAMALVGGVFGSDPRVNRIDIQLEKHAAPDTAGKLQTLVGDRAVVATPTEHGKGTQEIVGGMQVGFLLCSAGAMVVGLFLVYNALSVTVAERRHDIGILRSIGATRGQVIRLFVAAAAVLGLIGAAAGVPLGVGLARFFLRAFEAELSAVFLNPDADPGALTLSTAAMATAAGLATSILAAVIPAIQAASDEPADAVRRTPGGPGGAWRWLHRLTCGVLIFGGIGMILLRHELPTRVGAFGGMLATLVGLLLSAPIFVSILVRIVQPVLRRVLPIEARLAADNLTRSPGRTGLVIGALGAGVAVMIQTAGVGRSNEEPVVRWIDEVIQADRMILSGSLSEAISAQAPLEGTLPSELAKLPGVDGAFGVRYRTPDYNGTRIFITALDAGEYCRLTGPRLPGGLKAYANIGKLAGSDGAVVSENFAHRHKVDIGDVIELAGPQGMIRLPILATIPDYSWSRGTIFLDRAAYRRMFDDDQVDVAHVFYANPSADAAVSRYATDHGLIAQDRAGMRALIADIINRVYLLAFLQQLVVGLVAGLGVVTALLISVLQRKRELGLLLAVGATPGQVIRSVLAEAALMGAFGTLLGILIGLPLEWYVLRVILPEESGFEFPVLFPWRPACAIAVGAITLATLAGLLPAYHAVKTRIVDAIAHE